ncbi:MAG: hypothetical protein F4205_10900, partial [Gemmatimonadetes bacterium]|nr:hypothetical protein [Gemmatimonadota bacterium]
IPVEIGNLVNLRWLNVDSNRLTGEIPLELGELTNLRTLALQANLLTGEIPRELGNLASLRGLYLGYNDFTGPIPAELGNLAALTRLGLERNDFSGPIPSSFLHLDLARIRIHGNDSLCIPGTSVFVSWLRGIEYRDEQEPLCNAADVAVLQSLYELAGGPAWTESAGWLGDDGVEDWYGVTADSLGHVTILDLGRNGLRGQLPAHIDGLAHMTELRMSGNEGLSGRLPLVLTRLSLRVLHYAETGLCAPGDALFQAWLTRVESQEGTGLECPPLSDREILEVLYHAASGPDWTNSENWLTDAPLREWHGIDTDREGEVVGLVLFDNGLVGRIPPELGRLTALQRLVLWRNGLTGPIPPELGNLANLQRLNLVTNALEGPIPAELGDLTRLWELDLGNNTLEGPIPAKLGKLTSLTRLHLVGNDLTGSIPAALGNLVNLWELSLGRNALTGSLPAELGEIARLERFYAGHNDLSGPVPPEFGELTELREIALSSNADMTGALPSSLINLRSLETFEASGTQLCAPSDGAFLEWLEGLPNPRVPQCERTPSAAYLVQAVQSREFPVPLVAGEEALLRVFVTATQANRERLPPVRASFHLNGALAHVADLSGKAGPIPTSVDEGSLATSANEVIPATVVQPGLEMVIEIDPEGTLDPALGIAKRIPAEGRLSVNVLEMPLFDLTIIPFLRTADPDSTILDAVASTIADPEEWLWRRRPYLPVGDLTVRAHEPVMSSTNDAYALLSQTRMIRAVEGGTGYFMGTMSRPVTRASGLAERGGWNLFSLLPGPTGHELGHSFGLSHAPCGRVTGTDPAYPYPDAQIGVWGYDPLDGVLVPPNRPDIMSYCGGWISDYHYAKALRHRLTKEGASAAAPATSLLLWGGTDSTSTPFLEPAFVVDAPALLPDSTGEHLITGRASDGAQLFSFSFTMPETADGDGSSSFAFVVPVRPALEGQLASITLTGPGGSATLDGDSDEPMVILRNTRNGQVRGILRDVPPPAQTAADAVGQTVGPGLETLFSRGIPGEAAWRR